MPHPCGGGENLAQWTVNGLDIYNNNNLNNGYVGIGTGTLRTPLITKLQLFMPYPADSTHNRLSLLLEGGINQSCYSLAEFSVAKIPHISIYSSFATAGDAILSVRGECAGDLILTVRDTIGKIRFGTTPDGT